MKVASINFLLPWLVKDGVAAREEFHIMMDLQAKSTFSSGLLKKLKALQAHYDGYIAKKEESAKISITFENDNCIFFDESFLRERQLLSAYEIQFFHQGHDMNEVSHDDVGNCDVGYHVRSRVGASNIQRPYRLAVIPSDPLNAYELGGMQIGYRIITIH